MIPPYYPPSDIQGITRIATVALNCNNILFGNSFFTNYVDLKLIYESILLNNITFT